MAEDPRETSPGRHGTAPIIITAVASVATAVVLPPLVPKVMHLLEQARLSESRRLALESAHAALEERVRARTAELRDALAHAEESNRLKEAFLSTVSHELAAAPAQWPSGPMTRRPRGLCPHQVSAAASCSAPAARSESPHADHPGTPPGEQ